MKTRTLALLVVLGVIAVAGGWYFGTARTPSETTSIDAGKLMFPDLAPRLEHATKIQVTHQGKTLEIDKHDGSWGLADRAGYPVQTTKLRGMLTALTELRLVEPRTSDPSEYSRLGVEDPTKPNANSDLLVISDASDHPIVRLIVGHRRIRTEGNVPEQVYVRRPDQAQSWLAEGNLEVDADPQLWLDRDIMNIDHARIASVKVTRGDTELDFARNGSKLNLTSPTDHPPLDDYKLDDIDRDLELLTFQEVRPAKETTAAKVGEAVFTTTDGMTITVTVSGDDKDVWATFQANGEGKTKPEADRLNARLAGWSYQLGSWKEKSLVPTLDDLKAAPPAKPATTPPSAAPTAPTLPPSATQP